MGTCGRLCCATTRGHAVVKLHLFLHGRFGFLTKLNSSCLFTWRIPHLNTSLDKQKKPNPQHTLSKPGRAKSTHLAMWRTAFFHTSARRNAKALVRFKKRKRGRQQASRGRFQMCATRERRSCSSEHDETREPVACPLPLSLGAENSPP